jgi:hypothetical protein
MKNNNDASLLRITYELGTKPGTGKISYWKIDTKVHPTGKALYLLFCHL